MQLYSVVQNVRHAFRQCQQLRPDLASELLMRVGVIIVFKITDDAVPFKRIIQPEEVWLYKYPHQESFIEANTLHALNMTVSLIVVWIVYRYYRNHSDAINAFLGVTLSIYLSHTVTNFIKLSVGRPRPDFFARCFSELPEDDYTLSLAACDKPDDIVNQGYKSFPSGHSTMAFGCMAYLSFYLAMNLKTFSQPRLPHPSLRLIAFIAPLVFAAVVAVSRTADYHHHWQDVSVGAVIGVAVAYMCYRQDFPGLTEARSGALLPLYPPVGQPEPLLSGVETY